MKVFESGFGNFSSRAGGANAAAEEGFTCVNVTHADNDSVVHDVLFDGGGFSLAAFDEVGWLKVVLKGFRSEVFKA